MPGGRSEVSGTVEAKRDASPRSVHLRGRLAGLGRVGQPAPWRSAKEVPRARNLGAVTEPVRMVSGFGRLFLRGAGPGRIFDADTLACRR